MALRAALALSVMILSVASCRAASVATSDAAVAASAATPGTDAASAVTMTDAGSRQATVLKAEPRTMTLSGKVPVKIDYPAFVTTSATATEALRQGVEGELKRRRAAFLHEAASEDYPNCKEGPTRTSPGAGPCELSYVCKATLARGRGASMICDGYEGLGGAHPTKIAFAENYLLDAETPRRLTIDEVVVDRAAKTKLLRRAVALLEKQHGDGLASYIDVPALIRDRAVIFNFVPEGIRITFDSFPFVIGPLAVTVPRSEVVTWLRHDIVAAFD